MGTMLQTRSASDVYTEEPSVTGPVLKRWWSWLQLVTFISSFLGVASLSLGHSDPLGEVHPHVVAQQGTFTVYFTEVEHKSAESGSPAPKEQLFRATVTNDGLRDREEVAALPGEIARRGLLGYQEPVIPLVKGDPLLPREWEAPALKIDQRFAQENLLTYHFLGSSPRDKASFLYVGAFRLTEDKRLGPARIGDVGTIYSSPVASRSVRDGSHLYIAWIEERDRRRETEKGGRGQPIEVVTSKTQVVLSRWNMENGKVTHRPIRRTFGVNSHLDLEVADGRAAVVWHEGVMALHSRIGSALVNVEDDEFAEILAYSPVESFQQPHLDAILKERPFR